MEDLCQSSSIHVYVFLHRKVGVNSGHSDQLALAESGLLTLDPCWVVLSINPLGSSWSWCSILSSGSAKHTATFTLQLPLSVSLALSSVPRVCQLAPRVDLLSPWPHWNRHHHHTHCCSRATLSNRAPDLYLVCMVSSSCICSPVLLLYLYVFVIAFTKVVYCQFY